MATVACLLDTNVFIEHLRTGDKARSLLRRLNPPRGSAMSAVTLMELEFGTWSDEHRRFLRLMLRRYPPLHFDATVASAAGELYRKLASINRHADARDLMIAATAIANHMPLATLNVSHFEGFPQLRLLKASDA